MRLLLGWEARPELGVAAGAAADEKVGEVVIEAGGFERVAVAVDIEATVGTAVVEDSDREEEKI